MNICPTLYEIDLGKSEPQENSNGLRKNDTWVFNGKRVTRASLHCELCTENTYTVGWQCNLITWASVNQKNLVSSQGVGVCWGDKKDAVVWELLPATMLDPWLKSILTSLLCPGKPSQLKHFMEGKRKACHLHVQGLVGNWLSNMYVLCCKLCACASLLSTPYKCSPPHWLQRQGEHIQH